MNNSTTRSAVFVFMSLVGLGIQTPTAFAWSKYVPVNSTSMVGMVGSQTKIVSQVGATCTQQDIEPAPGALTEDTRIHIAAAGGNERIYAVGSGGVTFCGLSMTKILTAGFRLDFFGADGDDILVGDTVARVFGDDGNDLVRSERPNQSVRGGAGNDAVFSSTSSTTLSGEAGNDAHCVLAPATQVTAMNGGPSAGTDTRCGAATTITNIDSVNCAVCAVD